MLSGVASAWHTHALPGVGAPALEAQEPPPQAPAAPHHALCAVCQLVAGTPPSGAPTPHSGAEQSLPPLVSYGEGELSASLTCIDPARAPPLHATA